MPATIGHDGPITGSPALLAAARHTARQTDVSLLAGSVFTSDVFYEPNDDAQKLHTANGVLCVEMECAALYSIAAMEGAEALAVFTMTDHLVHHQFLSAQERQEGVDEMIELALNTAVAATTE